ncbi:MAG: HYR domain-containing protein [Flavobacteriales bacterium]|nr:HYR domain-containing protein [Flavobacteriales bacterium]MCB9448742.1 HYR domain-containing protein [Flavobacteriales bacterium]
MKKLYSMLLFLSMAGTSLQAQTLLLQESFETDGNGSRYAANEFASGSTSSHYFTRHKDGDSQPMTNDPTGEDGTYYFVGEGLLDIGSNPIDSNGVLTLNALNVSGYNLSVKILLALGRADGTRFEQDDEFLLQYNMDGGGWNTIGAFYGSGTGASSIDLTEDTDLNGTADGTALTNAFQEFTYNIPATGTSVQIRFFMGQDGTTEEVAVDNIRVYGTTCTDPDVPTVSASPTSICPGANSTLTITGNLNDATQWMVYSGSCGGTKVDSTASSSIVVSPSTTTTYYIRGEGGCVTPGSCGSATVTATDATNPTISCPGDQDVYGNGSCQVAIPDYTGSATVSDNCDPSPTVTQSPVAGTLLTGVGTSQVITLTATDASANTAQCTFTITVKDTTPPVMSCPSDRNLYVDGSCQASLPDYTGLVSRNDNCYNSGLLTVVQSPSIGTALSGAGTTQVVTVSASDPDGNTAQCSFTVTLVDSVKPTLTGCPGDRDVYVNSSCQYALPDFRDSITVGDNCGAPTVTQSPAPGYVYTGAGSNPTITLTVTDGSNNKRTCTFKLLLKDTIPPSVTCPSNKTLYTDGSCQVSLPNYTASVSVSDNCGGSPTVTQSPVAGTILSGTGTTQVVTMTATDGSGNAAQCTFTVTLQDTTKPTITGCPGNQSLYTNASCQATMPDYVTGLTIADNCDGSPTVTQVPAAGTVYSGAGTNPTVTITATDASGNKRTCSFSVTLVDTIKPTVTCPGDFDIYADASCNVALPDFTSLVTRSDNCYTSAALTATQSPAPGTVINGAGTTQLITITVSDPSSNSQQCSFTVTVVDTVKPTLTGCPADHDLFVNGSCQVPLPDYTGSVTVSDNCGVPTLVQSPTPGTLYTGAGTNPTVTLTATDGSGNITTCSFKVTLVDTIVPTVSCPGNKTMYGNATCEVTVPDYTSLVSYSDNCAGFPTVTQSPAPGVTLEGSGDHTITMNVTDASGFTGQCTFLLTVLDTFPPSITCPADQPVYTNSSCQVSLPDFTGIATVVDYCDASPVVTQSPTPGTILTGLGSTQLITLTATDSTGNATQCSFTVTVTDSTRPSLVCVPDEDLYADGSCNVTLPDYTGLVTVSDYCDGSPVVTQSPAAGTVLSGGGTTQVVTISATDASSNVAQCSFTVTVKDTIKPTMTGCPADQDLYADASCQLALPDFTGSVTVADNCGAPTVTQSPAAGTVLSGAGTTQLVTITTTDGSANAVQCSFTITVKDTTRPAISCPADQDLYADGSCQVSLPDYTGSASVADNCDGSPVVTQSPVAGTVLNGAGTTQVVTITATDASANVAQCSFTVTVKDTTKPSLSGCPGDQDLYADGSCQVTVPDYTGSVTATDNCDGSPVVTQSPAAGTVLSGGGTTQVVTITATDASSNAQQCSFTLTVKDTIKPTIACPLDQDVIADGSCQVAIPDYTSLATVADNCGTPTVTQSPAAGTILNGAGTTQLITLTATDGSANAVQCSFTITVKDTTRPSISCPADEDLYADASCQVTLPDYTGSASVSDNCDGSPVVTQSPVAGTVLNGAGTTQLVTITATDASANIAQCSFTVTVKDTIKPTLSGCPADQDVYADASCQFTVPDYTGSVTAADNCGTPTVTQSPAAGTILSGAGTTQVVTITATDAASNATQCSFTITVKDTIKPQLTCPGNQPVYADASCQGSLPDFTGLATVSDNCGSPTVTQSPSIGTVVTSDVTVTLTATDGSGNFVTCSFTALFVDSTAPAITCPGNQTLIASNNCDASLPDYTSMVTVTDNCDGAPSLTQSPAAGTTISSSTTVTMSSTDASGNTATCTFQVTLQDTTSPVISCPGNQTVYANAFCTAFLPDYRGLGTATDNCDGSPTISQSPSPGTLISSHTMVTLTATDASSNTSQCSFQVVFIDTVPPVITCPGTQTVPGDASCQGTIGDYTSLASAYDACGGTPSITQSPASGTSFSGSITVTLTATDDNSNTSSCTFTVMASDTTPPLVTCPGNQTIYANSSCQAALPDFTSLATTSDQCGGTPVVTQSPAPGTMVSSHTLVTLTSTDGSGNSNQCTFQAIFVDTVPPVIACPGTQTVPGNASCQGVLGDYTSLATASDACGGTPAITQSPVSGTTFSGSVTVTLTAIDDNSNTASCTFTVMASDTTPPVITCPGNQMVYANSGCTAALPDFTGLANSTDQCGDTTVVTQSPAPGTMITSHTLITLTSTDVSGNSSQCTFQAIFVDTVPPMITCPGDQTVPSNANCEGILGDYTSLGSATDACGGTPFITQNPPAGSMFTGIVTVTLTATDDASNIAQCIFKVLAEDTTAPSIVCPGNQYVYADASCQVALPDFTGLGVATDKCDPNPVITQSPAPGSIISTHTSITLIATDASGNTAQCSFMALFRDTMAPVVTCPGNQYVTSGPNCLGVIGDYTSMASATDNCGGTPFISQSPAPGTNFNSSIVVTLTATDASANVGTCTFLVIAEDSVKPTISCPNNQTLYANGMCQAVLPDYSGLATASDNCDPSPVVSQSPAAGTIIGDTATITLTVFDVAGNMSQCQFNVFFVDTVHHSISLNGDTLTCMPAADSYQWLLDGNPIVGATGQTHVAQVDGGYSVIFNAGTECADTTDVMPVIVTGVGTTVWNNDVKVFPNPFTGAFRCEYTLGASETVVMTLYNMLGEEVVKKVITQSSGRHTEEIQTDDLEPGVYLFNVQAGEFQTVRRVIRK